MPTGYTAELCERDQSFEEFALRCSRAFGALIEMRDDPLDAPIPEAFKPSDYLTNALASAKAELARLSSMNEEEAERWGSEQKSRYIALRRESLAKTLAIRNRLGEMVEKVVKWEPPTSEHRELKEFMLEQLRSTIKYDGNTSYCESDIAAAEAKSPQLYWIDAQQSAKRNVAYYTEEITKEEKRYKSRNAWLRQLRDSLRGEPVGK